jgi:hypothetical protein
MNRGVWQVIVLPGLARHVSLGMSRLAWTLPLRLAWLASLAACSSGVAPWSPGLRRELTDHDYTVYSAWLLTQRSRPGIVLVDDRTTSTSYRGLSEIWSSPLVPEPFVCPAEPGGLVTPPPVTLPPQPWVTPSAACASGGHPVPASSQSPTRDEASQDQRVQQELSLPLEPNLTGAAYRLVHDPVPEDLMRQAGLMVAFSRVGFDSRLQVATFQVLVAPVYGGRVSDAAAYRVWVERTGVRWDLVELELVGPVGVLNTALPVGTGMTMTCDSTHTTNCVWPPGPIPVPLPLPRPR